MKHSKVFLCFICLILLCTSFTACQKESDVSNDPPKKHTICIAEKGKLSDFKLVYGSEDDETSKLAAKLANSLKSSINVSLSMRSDFFGDEEYPFEILMGVDNRPYCSELRKSLKKDEYVIKVITDTKNTKIIFEYKGVFALMGAIDKFMSEYVDVENGVAAVPSDLEVRGSCSEKDAIIVSKLPRLRDPAILVENGVYYAYGTNWLGFKNTSGDLKGDWESLGVVATKPADSDTNYWAPEVHKYNGAYYMFTTYHSTKTGHRGCTIMRSDSPEGPFVEITNGHITPHDWDAIDGTFYVDPNGQPWMVFVHEWTCTDDGIGRMAAAKLSEDLTHFISEPVDLFRADDAPWAKGGITDGCWMYRCEDGQLLMLWSNRDKAGYCVGIARSADGRVDGEWTQDKELLYSKDMPGAKYDGGHGMLFYDLDGQMYLSIHSPNSSDAGRVETPIFIAVREQNGTLVWDLLKK